MIRCMTYSHGGKDRWWRLKEDEPEAQWTQCLRPLGLWACSDLRDLIVTALRTCVHSRYYNASWMCDHLWSDPSSPLRSSWASYGTISYKKHKSLLSCADLWRNISVCLCFGWWNGSQGQVKYYSCQDFWQSLYSGGCCLMEDCSEFDTRLNVTASPPLWKRW